MSITVSDGSTPALGEHSAYLFVIPSGWKLVLAHYCFFRLRLRNAASGFPVSS
jgi:hypothetical protein